MLRKFLANCLFAATATFAVIASGGNETFVDVSTCDNGLTEVSVEGVEGIFCVYGAVCSGLKGNGNCPKPQEGLTFGSYCGVVASGVYGCKPSNGTDTDIVADSDLEEFFTCIGSAAGNVSISVVGAGTFCASEPVCVASTVGNCPDVQFGLDTPSRCELLSSGVYGCVV
jgi:hypothetical protein